MRYLWWLILGACSAGCSALPDIAHQPRYHNPFPQLTRVAVLPFFNQSADPTVDQDKIALAYYNELQAIRGFEVIPVGVAKAKVADYYQHLQSQQPLEATPTGVRLASLAATHKLELQSPAEDFQRLAQFMNVDVLVVGSVTEYSPYYPPRLGLAVRWYAANPSFHPIPPGYGLPWGTPLEEYIPSDLVFEAEFALAQEQLRTQTPECPPPPTVTPVGAEHAAGDGVVPAASGDLPPLQSLRAAQAEQFAEVVPTPPPAIREQSAMEYSAGESALPPEWPDPRGFVPPPPSPTRPAPRPQSAPIMTHTRLYHGNDAEFTERLANYVYFRDDARFGDWQGYLQRSDDFIRFCCHLHITEMLAARGGAGESRLVFRWPIRRYER